MTGSRTAYHSKAYRSKLERGMRGVSVGVEPSQPDQEASWAGPGYQWALLTAPPPPNGGRGQGGETRGLRGGRLLLVEPSQPSKVASLKPDLAC